MGKAHVTKVLFIPTKGDEAFEARLTGYPLEEEREAVLCAVDRVPATDYNPIVVIHEYLH